MSCGIGKAFTKTSEEGVECPEMAVCKPIRLKPIGRVEFLEGWRSQEHVSPEESCKEQAKP